MMINTSATVKIFLASVIGTILEWYDFSLFAFLTPTLAKLFFPTQNALLGTLLTYAIFAIGFFVRPVGAILFGHVGDKQGRKKSLTWSIVLMSIPTCLMGLLPTYQTIGIAAPILLIFLRLCQGLSVGGESTGAVLFGLESLPHLPRGMLGATLWSITGLGLLAGSFCASLVIHSQLEYAWRIPFIAGLITGLIGFFLRHKTQESVVFEKLLREKTTTQFPLLEIWKYFKKYTLIIIGLYALSAMITYLIFIFMPNYVVSISNIPANQASSMSTLSLLASTLLMPLGGYISDKIGRKKVLLISTLLFILFSSPLFYLISQGNIYFITAEIIFVLLAMLFQGAVTATVYELIPIRIRYSVLAVGYNMSYSLFGGTAPFIATYLVHLSGSSMAPGFYLSFGALLAFFATLALSNKNKVEINKYK